MLVTIPTAGESQYIGPLVQSARNAGCDVVVVANNATPAQRQVIDRRCIPDGATIVDGGNGVRSLYTIWNQCLEITRQDEVGAILNDDVFLHPDSFARIEASIRQGHHVVGWNAFSDPQPRPESKLKEVHGTYKTHGLAGFAFAYAPQVVPSFDDGFNWWYGDDDWVEQCKAQGLRLWVEQECGIKHHTSTTQLARPWVMRDVAQDKQRFEEKWKKT